MKNRYKQSKVNGKKTLHHRKVMEEFIGRKLDRLEYVHHIDHNKLNNDISNLKIVTPEEHGLEHTKHPLSKACEVCNSQYTPVKTKRARQKTCGKECMRKLLSIRTKNHYQAGSVE